MTRLRIFTGNPNSGSRGDREAKGEDLGALYYWSEARPGRTGAAGNGRDARGWLRRQWRRDDAGFRTPGAGTRRIPPRAGRGGKSSAGRLAWHRFSSAWRCCCRGRGGHCRDRSDPLRKTQRPRIRPPFCVGLLESGSVRLPAVIGCRRPLPSHCEDSA